MSLVQPNLKEYTSFEVADLATKWMELEEAGYYKEAEKVMLEIPLIPGIANNAKEEMGIQALIATGANLSKAVKKYGQKWLEQ